MLTEYNTPVLNYATYILYRSILGFWVFSFTHNTVPMSTRVWFAFIYIKITDGTSPSWGAMTSVAIYHVLKSRKKRMTNHCYMIVIECKITHKFSNNLTHCTRRAMLAWIWYAFINFNLTTWPSVSRCTCTCVACYVVLI